MHNFIFLLAIIVGIFAGGTAAQHLWLWFMVPLGIKAISFWHAVGLSALLSIFLGARGIDLKNDRPVQERALDALLIAIVIPALGIALGWIAKQLM